MLIKNIRTFTLIPEMVKTTDLRVSGSEIVEEGPSLAPLKDEEVHDLDGRLVLPGFVNAHTHLYSSLSRGMPAPAKAPADFTEILKKIWWKLDAALDDETIYYSALVGAIDALRCGTTTIVDHHASPSSINGSLDLIKSALQRLGMRGVLCYEVTDRGGDRKRDEGLEENEGFIERNKTNEDFRGLVGAHAAFTLSDESLRLCRDLVAKHDAGIHIHVSEDVCDPAHSMKNHGMTVIERLTAHDLLNSNSVLAHCVHLAQGDYETISKSGSWVVHNPRSNMNNRVGYASLHRFGNGLALGTDGFPSDMLEEAGFAFFKGRDSRADEAIDFGGMISGGQRMISRIFGREFGSLCKGAVADLLVMDYREPTPMEHGNLLGHYLFGMRSSMVESVMIGGKWVMKGREILGVNENEVFERSRHLARELWKRTGRMS